MAPSRVEALIPLNNRIGLPFIKSVPSSSATQPPFTSNLANHAEPRALAAIGVHGPRRVRERRGQPRARIEVDVSLHTDSRHFAGFTENVSLSGAFVATHLVEKVNTLVRVTLHFDAGPVGAVGEVRWTRRASESSNLPPGMGIRFVATDLSGTPLLERLLAEGGSD